jgi:hypothetical protein
MEPDKDDLQSTNPAVEEKEAGADEPVVTPPEKTEDSTPVIDSPGTKIKSKKRFHFTKKEKIAILLVVLAFVLGAGGMYAYAHFYGDNQDNNQQAEPTPTPTPTTEPTTIPVSERIIWLETPQEVAALPIFDFASADNPYGDGTDLSSSAKYYLVGTVENSTDKIYFVSYAGGMFDSALVLRQTGDIYTVYQQHSPTSFNPNVEGGADEYQGIPLNPNTTIDENAVITDITIPSNLTYNDQGLTLSNGALFNFVTTALPVSSEHNTYNKLADLDEGALYEATTTNEATFKVIHYELLLKDHELYRYVLSNALFEAGVPNIWWSDTSTSNTAEYKSPVMGCGIGGGSIEVAKNIDITNLTQIGTSGSTPIYGISDTANPLLQKHYEEYTQFYSGYGAGNAADVDTIEEFVANHGIYLAKDALDQWVVMGKSDYVPAGGCAKPVVYLYPSVPTFVNVAVDAQVTLSDPQYPALGGWQNVFALPNGQLIYNQQGYDSLFWEGYGKGEYPQITSGKFVKQGDAANQIRTDLYAQGLNNKEVADFMEFWTSKIPSATYVRISWLDTQDMEQLAKLRVTPAPQTLIRVFLDMEGVDKPYPLAEQQLTAQERNGFTVVEWGGLANDGSVPQVQ